MFKGADPGAGWRMTDPLFGRVPTLGACMPNIRRAVLPGDFIFIVSGSVSGVQQYVVGGFRVAEKISALEAFERFPKNRMQLLDDGKLAGNIIVNYNGTRNELDYHSNFEKRIENYVVGRDPLVLETHEEIDLGRKQTLGVLQDVLKAKGQSIHDVVSRWRRLDQHQIEELVKWMRGLKQEGAR
jgi:hypothetical protein